MTVAELTSAVYEEHRMFLYILLDSLFENFMYLYLANCECILWQKACVIYNRRCRCFMVGDLCFCEVKATSLYKSKFILKMY